MRTPTWTKKTTKKDGYYWYRDEDRSTVLHVFDPLGNGIWKVWDWNRGRLMLCQIADYPGEWFGPLAVPK